MTTEHCYEGGCLCGLIRYKARGEPQFPHWCHCQMCRRATGVPAAAWVNFRLAEFSFTGDDPSYYQSSANIQRGFCSNCGASICTLEQGDDFISVLLGTLDDPNRIRPRYHIWTTSGVVWMDVNQDIPKRS